MTYKNSYSLLKY